MLYRLILRSGYVHIGDDERSIEDLLEDIVNGEDTYDELPATWAWYAGLHVHRGEIVAVETTR
jgi:hypothetical protein